MRALPLPLPRPARWVTVATLALFGAACLPEDKPVANWTHGELEQARHEYLTSSDFRRQALLTSLENHDNTYSRQRIASYARAEGGGWDALPEWNPRSERLRPDGSPITDTGPVWSRELPATAEAWVELGRRVFFTYPLRAEPLAEFALTQPAVAADSGLERDADGALLGLVSFVDVDGRTRVGITCALCHATVEDGVVVEGAARRRFDYGKLRLAFHEATKTPLDPQLARRFAAWGPGRADVTEDDDEDPVAIPDLFGLAEQVALTQAGTIRHTSPVALAIRQETQLLHSNHERVRPPRELAWALALYLYSLKPSPRPPPDSQSRGATLFAQHCQRCHSNPVRGGSPLPAELVGTDPALANGAARGTGLYRPPVLLRIEKAAPYLHHGAVPSLEALFSEDRFREDYVGPLGRGAVAGHAFGVDLPNEDTDALITWLRSL
jgi:cytochrome c5